MVYDEGFDIIIGNQSYFAFSRYSPRGKFGNTPGNKKWQSQCYATLNGWFHIGDKWGCFYATKEKVGDPYKVTNGEVANKNIVLEGIIKRKDDTDDDDGIKTIDKESEKEVNVKS